MTNINGINGYGYGYGVNNFAGRQNSETENADKGNEAEQNVVPEQKPQVGRDEVMQFLEKYNFFVAPASTQNTEGVSEVDAETQDRIAGYMEKFELIYGIIEEEFGSELAPLVMDFAMDILMNM